MDAVALVRLSELMQRTRGIPEIVIGLIDGPINMTHADLAHTRIRTIPGKHSGACTQASSIACQHGTFIAGILSATRGSAAPAICPNCTLLVRPIFTEPDSRVVHMPSATPEELALAILDCIEAGARIVNLSLALAQPSSKGARALEDALDYAARRGVMIVAAAGNQGTLGSTPLTRHPWVIPVAACTLQGRPMHESNVGRSIGRGGVSAPGDGVTSLGAEGKPLTFSGTSAAAPFVTGTIALLWSAFPTATASCIKQVVTQASQPRRATVVPPLLNAWAAYQELATSI